MKHLAGIVSAVIFFGLGQPCAWSTPSVVSAHPYPPCEASNIPVSVRVLSSRSGIGEIWCGTQRKQFQFDEKQLREVSTVASLATAEAAQAGQRIIDTCSKGLLIIEEDRQLRTVRLLIDGKDLPIALSTDAGAFFPRALSPKCSYIVGTLTTPHGVNIGALHTVATGKFTKLSAPKGFPDALVYPLSVTEAGISGGVVGALVNSNTQNFSSGFITDTKGAVVPLGSAIDARGNHFQILAAFAMSESPGLLFAHGLSSAGTRRLLSVDLSAK